MTTTIDRTGINNLIATLRGAVIVTADTKEGLRYLVMPVRL